jgi:hypothetical protein
MVGRSSFALAPDTDGGIVRIAQVAPLAEAVPPKLYGGTKRVIWWLTEALVDQGHDVTLFASGDSVTSAKLIPGVPTGLRLAGINDHLASLIAMLETVRERADTFDVLHFHITEAAGQHRSALAVGRKGRGLAAGPRPDPLGRRRHDGGDDAPRRRRAADREIKGRQPKFPECFRTPAQTRIATDEEQIPKACVTTG